MMAAMYEKINRIRRFMDANIIVYVESRLDGWAICCVCGVFFSFLMLLVACLRTV